MRKEQAESGRLRFWAERVALLHPLAEFWNSLAFRLAWPYAELIIRLWLAKLFFLFGVQQLMHWTLALRNISEDNPFSPLSPALSAYLSTGANLIGAILLALGFMTRYASMPLLLLAVITQSALRSLRHSTVLDRIIRLVCGPWCGAGVPG